MTLSIDKPHFELLKAYAEEAYPNECCGFLLGEADDAGKTVRATMPTRNEREAEAQHHRFLISPEMYLKMQRYARERGLEILGFYHSHPNGVARPSAYDVEHAWPWYSYVIVAVQEGQASEVTSWQLREDRSGFDQEKIVVLEETNALQT